MHFIHDYYYSLLLSLHYRFIFHLFFYHSLHTGLPPALPPSLNGQEREDVTLPNVAVGGAKDTALH